MRKLEIIRQRGLKEEDRQLEVMDEKRGEKRERVREKEGGEKCVKMIITLMMSREEKRRRSNKRRDCPSHISKKIIIIIKT